MIQSITLTVTLFASACTIAHGPGPGAPGQAPEALEAPGVDGDDRPIATGERLPYNGDINCVGSHDIVIRDALIEVGGDGPTVTGSCTIVLENCAVIAGGVAAVVRGSGSIRVVGSTIEGAAGAATLTGSGDIVFEDSEISGDLSVLGSGDIAVSRSAVRGRRRVLGSGEIHDDGTNQWM